MGAKEGGQAFQTDYIGLFLVFLNAAFESRLIYYVSRAEGFINPSPAHCPRFPPFEKGAESGNSLAVN